MGCRPADFVGALCNELGLSSSCIGRINLGGHKAFVGMPQKIAHAILADHATLTIRGTSYPLSLSFQSQQQQQDSPAKQSDAAPSRERDEQGPQQRGGDRGHAR